MLHQDYIRTSFAFYFWMQHEKLLEARNVEKLEWKKIYWKRNDDGLNGCIGSFVGKLCNKIIFWILSVWLLNFWRNFILIMCQKRELSLEKLSGKLSRFRTFFLRYLREIFYPPESSDVSRQFKVHVNILYRCYIWENDFEYFMII